MVMEGVRKAAAVRRWPGSGQEVARRWPGGGQEAVTETVVVMEGVRLVG